jgi:hypothetical protein
LLLSSKAYHDGFALPEDQITGVGEEMTAGVKALIHHVIEQQTEETKVRGLSYRALLLLGL